MPERKPVKQVARKPAKGTKVFTKEERAAITERAREAKAGEVDWEGEVLAKIAEMSQPDRGMAERLHRLIKANVPALTPRTWYGMPAYAKGGKNVCFFQPASKFRTRYATLGFNDSAHLDDGDVWPVAYAVKTLTSADEARILTLLKTAVS